MLLASVQLDQGRVREAAEQALIASRVPGQTVEAAATAALCLIRVGEMLAARDCLAAIGTVGSRLADNQLIALAHAYQLLGGHPASLDLLDRAAAQGYDAPDFRLFHGLELQYNGRLDDARRCLQDCLSLDGVSGRACLALARLARATPASNHLDSIRAQRVRAKPGSEEQAAFEFAAFEERHQLRDYAAAFAALERGNAIMHARTASGNGREDDCFDALARMTDVPFMDSSGTPTPAGPCPIFIVGMPRSGTTLLERMLGNHPDVASTGERPDFPRQLRWVANVDGNDVIDASLIERLRELDYLEVGRRYLQQTQWRASGKPFFVDKLPHNYVLLGMLHRALPMAPILHLVRDPMDVCFSNYRVLLGDNYPYCYDFHDLAIRYVRYRHLMRHWHSVMPGVVMDVPLADLVRSPEPTLTRIFAHCGLRPTAGCSDITRNHTAVATLSSAQVREPVHTHDTPAWRHYEKPLAPLQALLRNAGVIDVVDHGKK